MKRRMILMSKQNRDSHNRFRSKTIGIRLSPEEDELLNREVQLTGMTKQDYVIANCLHKSITVVPDYKVAVSLKRELRELTKALKEAETIHPELTEITAKAVQLLHDMYYTEAE